MKNYLIDKTNYESVKVEFELDLNELLKNKSVVHSKFGVGSIESFEIQKSLNTFIESGSYIKIKFEDGIRVFSLLNILNYITIDDEGYNILKYYIDLITKCNEIKKQIFLEEKQERLRREEEERLKKLEEIKQQERIKKLDEIKKSQLALSQRLSLSKNSKRYCDTENFYTGLGYIAKHVTKISASMPDYLESWFIGEFGNVEHKAVDQSIKCPSGLPSNYALAMQIDLDTNDNMPLVLTNYLSKGKKEKKPISNTEFVFNIMKNYGFNFGKTQDFNKILDSIPTDELENFKVGYSL